MSDAPAKIAEYTVEMETAQYTRETKRQLIAHALRHFVGRNYSGLRMLIHRLPSSEPQSEYEELKPVSIEATEPVPNFHTFRDPIDSYETSADKALYENHRRECFIDNVPISNWRGEPCIDDVEVLCVGSVKRDVVCVINQHKSAHFYARYCWLSPEHGRHVAKHAEHLPPDVFVLFPRVYKIDIVNGVPTYVVSQVAFVYSEHDNMSSFEESCSDNMYEFSGESVVPRVTIGVPLTDFRAYLERFAAYNAEERKASASGNVADDVTPPVAKKAKTNE